MDATWTLTSDDVDVDDFNTFTVVLNAQYKLEVNSILNKDGTVSDGSPGGTTYNVAVADDWVTKAGASANIEDLTLNGITVSLYVKPIVSSISYTYTSGVFTFVGSNFVKVNGVDDDIDTNLISITGGNDETFTLANSGGSGVANAELLTIYFSRCR